MQSRDNNMEINGKKMWKILDERAVQIWGKLKNVMKKWEEDYRLEGEKEKKNHTGIFLQRNNRK